MRCSNPTFTLSLGTFLYFSNDFKFDTILFSAIPQEDSPNQTENFDMKNGSYTNITITLFLLNSCNRTKLFFRAVHRRDNWGGGGDIHNSCSARRISFESDCFYGM